MKMENAVGHLQPTLPMALTWSAGSAPACTRSCLPGFHSLPLHNRYYAWGTHRRGRNGQGLSPIKVSREGVAVKHVGSWMGTEKLELVQDSDIDNDEPHWGGEFIRRGIREAPLKRGGGEARSLVTGPLQRDRRDEVRDGNSSTETRGFETLRKDKSPEPFVVEAMLLGGKGKWQEVLAMLSEHKRETSLRGGRPTIYAYNSAIGAMSRCRRWKEALTLLDEMKAKGVRPDVVSFNTAISACGNAGMWKHSLDLLDEMVSSSASERAAGAIPVLAPDAISFNAAMKACGKAGKWRKSLALLSGMEDAGVMPNFRSYSTTLGVLGQCGRWREALQLLDEMRERGFIPDAFSLAGAMHACGAAGRWDETKSLMWMARSLGKRTLNEVVYNTYITACGGAGRWKEALLVLKEMESGGTRPDVFSYSAAMKACGDAGRWEEALSVLDRMKAHGVLPNRVSYNTAISACGEAGKWEDALEVLGMMKAAGVDPDSFTVTAAVKACGDAGQWEAAMSLFERMCATGFVPLTPNFNAVIDACAMVEGAETTSIARRYYPAEGEVKGGRKYDDNDNGSGDAGDRAWG
ncbi:unnamed protein product, partial [Discosporangium mesarthrocarpum]